jgi:hypothetical protein
MAQTRFTCTLTRADEPACQSYARVTIGPAYGPQRTDGRLAQSYGRRSCPWRTRSNGDRR